MKTVNDVKSEKKRMEEVFLKMIQYLEKEFEVSVDDIDIQKSDLYRVGIVCSGVNIRVSI